MKRLTTGGESCLLWRRGRLDCGTASSRLIRLQVPPNDSGAEPGDYYLPVKRTNPWLNFARLQWQIKRRMVRSTKPMKMVPTARKSGTC